MQLYARSARGLPSVDSSQSSTATTRGSVGCRMRLPGRKSPCTMVGRSSGGTWAGSQAMSCSIASMRSVSEARYWLVQRWICRAK